MKHEDLDPDVWYPVSEFPKDRTRFYWYLVTNSKHKWMRFGTKFPGQSDWYYSSNTLIAESVESYKESVPTHFRLQPEFPLDSESDLV